MSLLDTPALAMPTLPTRTKVAAKVTTGPTSPVSPANKRDQRLDMFRGIALLMIFINHVPGTVFENFTNRNFGFSDAAEAFVFMSGMAAGLAYSNRISGSFWAGATRVWARARQLYFVHIVTTCIALAIFAAAAIWFGQERLLGTINMGPVLAKPLEAMIGIPALTHQLGYFNILPLYMTLLLVTPAMLVVGMRWPMALLIGSIVLWIVTGQFRLNLPNFPNPGGWFFNPLAWQLIFVVGLLSGVAMKRSESFVPFNKTLLAIAAGFLVLTLVWIKVPPVGSAANHMMAVLGSAGAPFYIVAHDKTFLTLPRLLHVLAVVYVASSLGVVRQFAESRYARPFTLLGRHGLAVFATGSVLSILLQAIKSAGAQGLLADAALIGLGIGVQLLLAWSLARTAMAQKQAAKVPAPAVA